MGNDRVQKVSFESLSEGNRGLVYLEPTPPQIVETMKVEGGRAYHGLVLPATDREGRSRHIALLTDYQCLLRLGRQVVQALDPSPQDDLLAELKEIRKLLEDHQK